MNEFLDQFLIESRELAEQATSDLLALEQAPDDRARLDSAFRAFHTLKGGAGIVEFAAMGRLLHAAEDVLAAVRAGDAPVTVDLISHCLTCLDQVVQWLDLTQDLGDLPGDADQVADRLAARFRVQPVDTHVSTADAGPPAWAIDLRVGEKASRAARTALRYRPDPGCFFRGDDPLARVARTPGLLSIRLTPSHPWPPLDAFDPFTCNLTIDALFDADADTVAAALATVSDQVEIVALPAAASPGGLSGRARTILEAQIALALAANEEGLAGRLGSAVRVATNVLAHAGLDDARAMLSHALASSLTANDPSILAGALGSLLAAPADAPEMADSSADQSLQGSAARVLRVDVDRIDALVRLTGELTVVKNALGHAARLASDGEGKALAQTLKEQHALLERLTVELQRSVIAIRVLPLRHVFQRFGRLVREMALTLGKSARLVSEGEETEADKAVVEALFDPLLHVLRNALDHGIEPTAERLASGKPETAIVSLRGFREGERVIIEVEDDGRGMDPARIRGIAAERKLLDDQSLSALSDEEALELVFTPGFSTAATVSDLSGRGVGMDAVRSAIEHLGGRVAVHSRAGRGATVRFTLPFTVMMTQVMIVEAGGQAFGVPFEAVVETLQLQRSDIASVGAAEAFVLRGRTVPLVSLRQTLGLSEASERPQLVKAVVTVTAGQLSALEVDGFGERLDVMLKPMDGLLAGMRGVAGTTLLGDGRVLIVLDLQELLQ